MVNNVKKKKLIIIKRKVIDEETSVPEPVSMPISISKATDPFNYPLIGSYGSEKRKMHNSLNNFVYLC